MRCRNFIKGVFTLPNMGDRKKMKEEREKTIEENNDGKNTGAIATQDPVARTDPGVMTGTMAMTDALAMAGTDDHSRSACIYVKTFGCSLNQSDSELMAGLLEDAGFTVTDTLEKDTAGDVDYDLAIINTCSVKNLAENKFWKEYQYWNAKKIPVIVAGCIPQAERALLSGPLAHTSVIGTRQLIKIVDIVNRTLQGEVVHDISFAFHDRLNLPKKRKSSLIEIIPISEGCLDQCSYCKTKHARGILHSYPREQIIAQFKSALDAGCKEFWITSQDTGCYGFDCYRPEKYFLPELLGDLLAIPGDFRIRLGMANPHHIKTIISGLLRVYAHPKMFKFLHIPVQAGNNRVLKAMRRTYTIEDFESIITTFRQHILDIAISTDLIVGFPEETAEEFQESLALLRRIAPDVLNLSRFWLRNGTAAAQLQQLPGGITKLRSEETRRVFDTLIRKQNKKWVGRIGTAIIDEIGKNNTVIARNDYYKQIIIKNPPAGIRLGTFVTVRIIASRDYDLTGEILS